MHTLNSPPDSEKTPRTILRARPQVFHYLSPVQAIAQEEAERAGITMAKILGAQRSQKYVKPRHIAMWRAARETKASLVEIGRIFGRDHTTVMYAVGKVAAAQKASHEQS